MNKGNLPIFLLTIECQILETGSIFVQITLIH